MFKFAYHLNGNGGSPFVDEVPKANLKILSGYDVFAGACLQIVGGTALRWASGGVNVYGIAITSAASASVSANTPVKFYPVNPNQVWECSNPAASGGILMSGGIGVTAALSNSAEIARGTCLEYMSAGHQAAGIGATIVGWVTGPVSAVYVTFQGVCNAR